MKQGNIWKKIPLLGKILIGIGLGMLVGWLFGVVIPGDAIKDSKTTGGHFGYEVMRWIATANGLLSGLLKFSIPIILIGFIAHGIAELGNKAGKMLGVTVGFAYLSTICAGILAFVISMLVIPNLGLAEGNFDMSGFKPIFTIEISPIMGSITALILAFILGVVASRNNKSVIFGVTEGIKDMADFTIRKIIIPVLPFLIFTVFADFAAKPGLADLLKTFGVMFLIIITLHWVMIVAHYMISGTLTKRNPFRQIKNMLPAYFTAVGTQSSAVTLPVTLECAGKNGLDAEVKDFVVPLAANVHLPGSMITITTCAMAVAFITTGATIPVGDFLPFLFVLGLAAVAAPGVPGGAIMVAAGFLTSMLGFGDTASALMVALYLAQDSFGTAGNVTTDPSVAALVERFTVKK